MAAFVYISCAILSFTCSFLLYRGYKTNQFRLLFWCALGFVGFAFNNIMLFADQYLIHGHDLSVVRTVPAFIGMIVMVYGLITESV